MPTSKTRPAAKARPKAAPAAPARKAASKKPAAKAAPAKARKPASLPKSDGDEGVQAYIASMEPWQAEVARRIDALIAKRVKGVRKAIRWHTPLYGVEGQGWFFAFNAFQRYVKLAFFKGSELQPVPPIATNYPTRYVHVHETDTLDEKQLLSWIDQAAALPGWDGGSPRNGGEAL